MNSADITTIVQSVISGVVVIIIVLAFFTDYFDKK